MNIEELKDNKELFEKEAIIIGHADQHHYTKDYNVQMGEGIKPLWGDFIEQTNGNKKGNNNEVKK